MENKFPWLDQPNLLAISGSRLYGINNADSDIDVRGMILPPPQFTIGLENFEQYESKESDTVIYSLKKFIHLLLNGNTQAIEIIFAPTFLTIDAIGIELISLREKYISQRYYNSVKGFALSEMKKVKGVRLEISDDDPKLYKSLESLTSCLSLKNHQRERVIELLEEMTKREIAKEVDHKPQIGAKRKNIINEVGYSPKNAANVIRILSQGIELFTEGKLTFPRPEAELLRSVRNAQFSLKEVEEIFDDMYNKFEVVSQSTALRSKPDIKGLNEWYCDKVKESL
jgi:predicted nucleotidyltransferase